MPAPNYPLPDLGELNSIADPKVRSALAQILAWANGGIESGALDTATRQLLPSAGDIRWTAKTQLPAGWLTCDGRPVLRTEYPALFAAIGTTYGSTGPTDFRLPDLAGRLAMGAGLSKNQDAGAPTVERALAARGGRETVLLTAAQSGHRAHAHGVSDPGHGHGVNDPGHAHGANVSFGAIYNAAGATASGNIAIAGRSNYNLGRQDLGVTVHGAGTGISIQGSGTGISIQNSADADAAQAHENMPPFTALHALIFAG
jgi:microcystin-dependent protein